MRRCGFLARPGEEDVNEVVGIAELQRRPDWSLVRIMHDDFAFRSEPIIIGFYDCDSNPFIRIEMFDLSYREDARSVAKKVQGDLRVS